MGKKEYIKANREWLEAKAGEDRRNGFAETAFINKVLSAGNNNGVHPNFHEAL